MNNQSLPVMLREAVALVERATPGEWRHVRENGSPTTGMNMIAGSVPGYIANVRDTGTGRVVSDTRLIVAAVNLLKQHGSALVGVVYGWQTIESAPRDGTYILVCNSHGAWIAKWKPVFQSGFRPSNPWASMMLNHDHIERPGRFDHPTHWRPLPAPPTQDSAMQQGGGGGE